MPKNYSFILIAILASQILSAESSTQFNTSFELKHKQKWESEEFKLGSFSYRARMGWTGEVNPLLSWKVALSLDPEETFDSFNLNKINLEEIYVSYTPIDGLIIKLGKFGWIPQFQKFGVLLDDDLDDENVLISYNHKKTGLSFYVKGIFVNKDNSKGPLLLAGSFFSSNIKGFEVSGHVGLSKDQFFPEPVSLLDGSFNISSSHLGIPIGFASVFGTNLDNLFNEPTYTVGTYVGRMDKVRDWMIAVHYYKITTTTWNTYILDTDYSPRGIDIRGVAAKISYRFLKNLNISTKYSFLMLDAGQHTLVNELVFNF